MQEYINEVKAVFLLYIILAAGLAANTLNCDIQYLLYNNPFVSQLFILLAIIFTIDFTSKGVLSPEQILSRSLIIYVFYLLMTKQNYITFIIIFILLFVIYYINVKMNYEEKQGQDTKYYQENINLLLYSTGIIAIVGYILYFLKQKEDHHGDFDILKFIFGTNKCTKLKNI